MEAKLVGITYHSLDAEPSIEVGPEPSIVHAALNSI
jgi:hypothetical protein